MAAVTINKLGLNRRERIHHINLKLGEPQRIDIVSEREEGYDGPVGVSLGNLPKGVTAMLANATIKSA